MRVGRGTEGGKDMGLWPQRGRKKGTKPVKHLLYLSMWAREEELHRAHLLALTPLWHCALIYCSGWRAYRATHAWRRAALYSCRVPCAKRSAEE